MPVPLAIAALVGSLVLDAHGILLLANALDSIDEGLIDDALVRNLLADLADEISSAPSSRGPDALARVRNGKAPYLRRAGGYLRAAHVHTGTAHMASIWTTVVSAAVWKVAGMNTRTIMRNPALARSLRACALAFQSVPSRIDFPISQMTPQNLTSSMAGSLLEEIAVEDIRS